jgi:ubiquinone/menaquinone biosynthesis C-methylase UbiE
MNQPNEKQAAAAFSKQALIFDAYDAGNTIIHYKRKRVREHVLRYLRPGSSILELNAGTGEDALFFARQGHTVHATDIAVGMQGKLREKVKAQDLTDSITTEICSFTALDTLKRKGPYDLIFSNFAGLNCTSDLDKVLRSFAPLVKPGGQVTLVILPTFSLWETMLLFRGRFRTAFRRLLYRRKGAPAHVEGVHFRCWYYSPAFVTRILREEQFELLGCEGLCTIVPPSYIEHFPERHSHLYNFLRRLEDKVKEKWPWRAMGDYYIISFVKTSTSLSRR